MSKKRYRIYKAGGEYQSSSDQNMPEEMSMMESGQAVPMAEDIMSDIKQSLQEGVELEDILIEKVKEGVELNDLGQILAEIGIPEAAIVEAFQYIQRLMSQEEEPPMEEPVMSRGAFVKQRLKEAQEGMSVDKSNLNLAAEDDVNNVSNLLKFTETNNMTNQFGQEYDDMMANQEMMPEARLGREARQQRRADRRERRQERREERRADRDARQAERIANREDRQAQRAYRQAYRNIAVPFGYNPPMIGAGMGIGLNPMTSGNMIFEGERGLFGRLKNYKIQIDGLGYPANYTRGLYKQGLINPGYVRQDYFRKQLPGEVMGSNTKPRNPNSDNNENPDKDAIKGGSRDAGKSQGTATGDNKGGGAPSKNVTAVSTQSRNPEGFEEKNPIDEKFDNIGDGEVVETGDGTKIYVKPTGQKDIGADDAIDWTLYGIGAVAVLDVLVTANTYRRLKKRGLSDKKIAEKATAEGAEKLSEKTVTKTSKVKDWLKNRKPSRDPLSGRFQPKSTTIPQYAKQKTTNLAKSVYKPTRNLIRKAPGAGKAILKILSRGRIKEDGGFVDSMDEMYGNPDLYRFTGGGDFDYFNGGMIEPQYEDVTDPYMPDMEHGGPHSLAERMAMLQNQNAMNQAANRTMRTDSMNIPEYDMDMQNQNAEYKAIANQNAKREALKKAYLDATTNKPKEKSMMDFMYPKQYGGIQYAAPGAVVDPGYNKEDPADAEKDLIEGETNYKDQYGKDARSLFEGIMANPDQKAAMMAMYKKQQQGSGGGGQGGMFLSSPYGNGRGYGNRRGFMNSVMGYNRPAVFQKTGQWLSPYSTSMDSIRNQSYKSGLPMLEGIPEGSNLTQVEVIKRNMFDRLFPGKDEDGNRNPRGPRKSIKYTFNQPGSSTPGLDTKDNEISKVKINPKPNFDKSGGNEIEEEKIIYDGSENQDGMNTISIEDQIEKDAANSRGAAAAMRTKADDRRDARKERIDARQKRRADRRAAPAPTPKPQSSGTFRPSTRFMSEGTDNMDANLEREAMMGNFMYGGYYEEGGVYDLTEEEIGAIMAAGGQIEFI